MNFEKSTDEPVELPVPPVAQQTQEALDECGRVFDKEFVALYVDGVQHVVVGLALVL